MVVVVVVVAIGGAGFGGWPRLWSMVTTVSFIILTKNMGGVDRAGDSRSLIRNNNLLGFPSIRMIYRSSGEYISG